jgi:hypothetical protein
MNKPKIKKICSGWLCVHIPEKGDITGCVRGLGTSPTEAYNVWKERCVQAHKEALNAILTREVIRGCLVEIEAKSKWKALKQFADRYGDWFVGGFICLFILAGAVLQTLAVVLK